MCADTSPIGAYRSQKSCARFVWVLFLATAFASQRMIQRALQGNAHWVALANEESSTMMGTPNTTEFQVCEGHLLQPIVVGQPPSMPLNR
eukprot:SAG11_NODE_646_length_7961_cov_2.885907_4_plen_90_part_00